MVLEFMFMEEKSYQKVAISIALFKIERKR